MVALILALLLLTSSTNGLSNPPTTSSKYQKNSPERFALRQENALQVFLASPTLLFRLGSGAFVNDYSLKFVKSEKDGKSTGLFNFEDNNYRVLSVAGYDLMESRSEPRTKRPVKNLQLYEFEGCPFCKKVREAVTLLDLDVVFFPCPKDGPVYREKVKEMGGKYQFPYLVDPNFDVQLYESDDIIDYLFDTYAEPGEFVPKSLKNPATTITAALSLLPRFNSGTTYTAQSRVEKAKPTEPVVLWGYEASPFVKIVREKLNELEIPFLLKTCARGSIKRDELVQKTGTFQVPYFEDPNTAESLFESQDIIDYLDAIYG
jgi:glutathione S-transferase